MTKILTDHQIDKSQNHLVRCDFFNGPAFILDESDNDYGLKADSYINENSPDNTTRAYRGDLKYFSQWATFALSFRVPFKLNEEDILKFIFHHLNEMPSEIDNVLFESGFKRSKGLHSLATVKRRLTSVTIFLKRSGQDDVCNTPKVKALLATFTKTAPLQKKAKAITLQVLNDLLETCDNSMKGIRDKALMLFAFSSGGRRRSEIADAEIKDLEEAGADYIFKIAKSKTDQSGKGHIVPIKGRAAVALKEWLTALNVTDGKIFRSIKKGGLKMGDCLTTVDINRIVKKRCDLAGYDAEIFSAHSLRAGFITESGKQNKPLGDTMALSGHKSLPVAMGYYQAGNVLHNQASNLAG